VRRFDAAFVFHFSAAAVQLSEKRNKNQSGVKAPHSKMARLRPRRLQRSGPAEKKKLKIIEKLGSLATAPMV
jgi:hypothetical protein